MEKQWQCCLLFLWPVMKFAYVVDVLYSLVITFHFIYPGCQRSSRSPAARNVGVSSADRRETSGLGS